jgi:hypothetical protein
VTGHDPSLKAEDTPSAVVSDWHKPITFEGLMETIEKEPLLKMILDARVAAFMRIPILKYSGYDIEFKVPEPIEYTCKGYTIYEDALDAARYGGVAVTGNPCAEVQLTGYERDPFWQQWQAQKAQIEAEGGAKWRTPIFTDDADVHAASYASYVASTMDWDSEEESTDPGVGPAPAEEYKLEAAPEAPYAVPTVDTDGLMKSDVCYLCGTKHSICHFNRSPYDSLIACIRCIEVHLNWKLNRDGTLTRVEPGL